MHQPVDLELIARRLDSRLTGIAQKLGWTYTRYADDLSFSAKGAPEKIGYLLARIRHITGDEGFAANEKKTRVLKQCARQLVTGVVVNHAPAAPRKMRRRMRAILHNASKTNLESQNRRKEPHFAATISGTIEFIGMVNRRHGTVLREKFDSVH
jgi:RNA-directed DNA polymerase